MLDAPAQRIVTLAPHLAEGVFAAGAGERLDPDPEPHAAMFEAQLLRLVEACRAAAPVVVLVTFSHKARRDQDEAVQRVAILTGDRARAVRFSFAPGDSLVGVAHVEPENGVTVVEVTAWLTDVDEVARRGDAFLRVGGVELLLEITGAEAFILSISALRHHLPPIRWRRRRARSRLHRHPRSLPGRILS